MNRSETRSRNVLALGLWLGLAYGLIEAAEVIALGFIPGALSWRIGNSITIFWFAPVFYGTVFALVALPVAGLARLVPRVSWDSILVPALVAWGAYLAARLHPEILAPWTATLFALGVGAECARQYRQRRETLSAFMVRTVPHFCIVVAALACAILLSQRLQEWWAFQRLPAVPSAATNVLLLVLDTQRGDHLSSYGYGRETSPRIDAMAREGSLFEKAYSSSSWTLPSHATLMTGQPMNRHRAGVVGRPYLDGRFPTLAEVLRDRGYATGAFVANTYWCGRQTGLARGFIRYEDFYGNLGDAIARTVLGRVASYQLRPKLGFIDKPGRKWSAEINVDLLDWLDGLGGRPFFAFVNYFDTHPPLLPPKPFANRYSTDSVASTLPRVVDIGALDPDRVLPPPDELRRSIDRYDESLLYLDAQIGALLDELRRRRLLNNTLVILTSDHGESFGDHGLLSHGHSLYADQLAVPLILRLPGSVPEGFRDPRPASIDQVPATVAQILGLDGSPFPGRSLLDTADPAPVLLAEVGRRRDSPQFWPVSKGDLSALITSRWHLIRATSGAVELYDMETDPGQLQNLVGSPTTIELIGQLEADLDRIVAGCTDTRQLHQAGLTADPRRCPPAVQPSARRTPVSRAGSSGK